MFLFGHLLWLPENAQARRALAQFIKPVKCPTGRRKNTWLNKILKGFNEYSKIHLINNNSAYIGNLLILCSDRLNWNKTVGNMMFAKRTIMQQCTA